jgi:hypothetical protein
MSISTMSQNAFFGKCHIGASPLSTHKSALDFHKFDRWAMIGGQGSFSRLADEAVFWNEGLEICLVITRELGKLMSFVKVARHVARNMRSSALDAEDDPEGAVDSEPKTIQQGV